MMLYKEGDVVKLHCPDPACACCDGLNPVIVIRPFDPITVGYGDLAKFDWWVKPLFHHTEIAWREVHMSFAVPYIHT